MIVEIVYFHRQEASNNASGQCLLKEPSVEMSLTQRGIVISQPPG
jgi:hypothetical protein